MLGRVTEDTYEAVAATPAVDESATTETGPSRPIAALLSFIWPGLGQAYKGQRQRALTHGLPIAAVVIGLIALVLAIGPLVFGLHLLNPVVSLGLIALIAALALWRCYSIVDAGGARTSMTKVTVLVLIGLTVFSHAWLANNAWAFYQAGQRITEPVQVALPPADPTPDPLGSSAPSSPSQTTAPGGSPAVSPAPESPLPGSTSRVTVLLVGVDNTHVAARGLTDTLIVASFDPVGKSLTMISIPRDTARLPYYAGGQFEPRINNLMQTAARNPEEFPDGAMGTLVNEVSYLVGVPIDYYAQIDIAGFLALVDMVGGVDVVLDSPIHDAGYQFSPTEVGFFLEAGPHHLDGKLATAYARSRHGPGNSDYERARRQQQILVALRTKLNDPRLMTNLPGVLYVLSNVVRTDAPLDRLPEIVSIAFSSSDVEPRRVVLSPPRFAEGIINQDGVRTTRNQLRMDEVARLSIELFGSDSRYAQEPAD